jgi:hypothetical protein
LEAVILDDPLPPSLPLAAVLGCHDPYSPKTFPSRFHLTGSSNQYSIEAEVDITDDFSFLYNRLHSREAATTKVMIKVVRFIRLRVRICCNGASPKLRMEAWRNPQSPVSLKFSAYHLGPEILTQVHLYTVLSIISRKAFLL